MALGMCLENYGWEMITFFFCPISCTMSSELICGIFMVVVSLQNIAILKLMVKEIATNCTFPTILERLQMASRIMTMSTLVLLMLIMTPGLTITVLRSGALAGGSIIVGLSYWMVPTTKKQMSSIGASHGMTGRLNSLSMWKWKYDHQGSKWLSYWLFILHKNLPRTASWAGLYV